MLKVNHDVANSSGTTADVFAVSDAYGQDTDLLSLLGNDDVTEYATAAFKTNRVINLHSWRAQLVGLDFKINPALGSLMEDPMSFGLDNAMMRLGFDYGITDQLTVGIGRSSFRNHLTGFLKYKILRQSTGKRSCLLRWRY